MKILIDMQGAQTTSSRHRGIGRYTRSFTRSVIKNRAAHDVHLALNGSFSESVESLRSEFADLLPPGNFHVWEQVEPLYQADPANRPRQIAAEVAREVFIASLEPDVVHLTSLFEGYGDNGVCSIGRVYQGIPTTVTLYDLIPLINPSDYLSNPAFRRWYYERLEHLRRADVCLAISDSTRLECLNYLNFPEHGVITVGTDADDHFNDLPLNKAQGRQIRKRYGISGKFILYTGGIDVRKNIERLICAYAELPETIKSTTQLAIVCSISDEDRTRLNLLVAQKAIKSGSVVLTGFVSEDELVAFYKTCDLFVFPSWHEGFGLPALEAIRCGAPVIAADRASLPEVVGFREALFDPFKIDSIKALMIRALTDEDFRLSLISYQAKHVERFSWNSIGKEAIARFELVVNQRLKHVGVASVRPRLAFVSPLPPAKSGIADYAAELLAELTRHYQIDLIVKDGAALRASVDGIGTSFKVVEANQFAGDWHQYDRIVYQFGNSDHHDFMFDLLRITSGTVVLHDFFLSGVVAYMELNGSGFGQSWSEELYKSHGYAGLLTRKMAHEEAEAVWALPCSFSVLAAAAGVIVHSEHGRSLAERYYGTALASRLTVVSLLRQRPPAGLDRIEVRHDLGLSSEDYIVCSFGMLGKSKLNHKLLEAWNSSSLASNPSCRLVFVGENDAGPYGQKLLRDVKNASRSGSVRITGWASQSDYCKYLQAADCAVQLRALSRGETSAAVLDCMNYGVPIIVNANGTLAETPSDAAVVLADEFSIDALREALEKMFNDPDRRDRMSRAGRQIVATRHDPRKYAEAFCDAIESHYDMQASLNYAISEIAELSLPDQVVQEVSRILDRATEVRPTCFLVDVSELALSDAKTGIQRVVRNLLKQLLMPDHGELRIEPIYLDQSIKRFRYARRFTAEFLEVNINGLTDDVVEFIPGDTLLLLDLNPHGLPLFKDELAKLSNRGVETIAVVYDLLPIRHPECFSAGAQDQHERWLSCVALTKKAIAISQTVAADLSDYFAETHISPVPTIGYFRLGSDLDEAKDPTIDPRTAASETIVDFSIPTFLMVGTIEPRKGHADVLRAFKNLWRSGLEINLCIIGKQGWLVETLFEDILKEASQNKHLIFLDSVDDNQLEQCYKLSTCLIAASINEGFGLPLVEAAQRQLPIIARDVPVFRELCGEHATYFTDNLETTIERWLSDFKKGRHVSSNGVRVTSWKESATQLLDVISMRPQIQNSESYISL